MIFCTSQNSLEEELRVSKMVEKVGSWMASSNISSVSQSWGPLKL